MRYYLANFNTGEYERPPPSTYLFRRMAHLLLNGGLVVWLSQAASELALGLETHIEPSFDPLANLQPELCAVPRGHYRSS